VAVKAKMPRISAVLVAASPWDFKLALVASLAWHCVLLVCRSVPGLLSGADPGCLRYVCAGR
jgi:hypothetical protein